MYSLEEDQFAFATALRRYRQRALLTHEALAERAGSSPSAISALERGKRRRPYPDTVRRLAEALELSPDERDEFVAAAGGGAPPLSTPRLPAPTPLRTHRFPLIGRDGDLARLVELTPMHSGRLLTLTGIGGGGKTRMALAVMDELRELFADDVGIVELAPISDPAQVPVAIAVALEIPEVAGTPVALQLMAALRTRRLLLLLDNCEHLIEACAEIAEQLLDACPNLVILATSQESLQLPRELRWRLPTLTTPEPDQVLSREELADFPAIQLFTARAGVAVPDFELTDDNHAAVAQICTRLGGHPLAIELAAARVQVLTVQQILERLDDAVHLLTGGSRSAPTRQQTLLATLSWSYALLTPAEQAVLRRLAVCVDGCEIEAAEAICGDDDLPEAEVLELVSRLVDRSLVGVSEVASHARYGLLEPVRQFLLAVTTDGERQATMSRHAAAYGALAQRATTGIHGPDQAHWLRLLERESGNLRAALTCLTAAGEMERALRLAVALSPFWEARGHLEEGRRWVKALVEQSPHDVAADALRCEALIAGGRLAYWQKLLDESASLLHAGLAQARRLDDGSLIAEALTYLGAGQGHRGAFSEAAALLDESLTLSRNRDDRVGIARSLLTRGVVFSFLGDHANAVAMVTESVSLFRTLADSRWTAIAQTMLGGVLLRAGETERAAGQLREGLAGHLAVGDRGFMVSGLDHLAAGLAATGQPTETARVLGAMAALSEVLATTPSTITERLLVQIEAAARSQLSAEEFSAAWDEGKARPLHEVISDALQALPAEPERTRGD